MAISLDKTLQGIDYTLYIVINSVNVMPNAVVLSQQVYQSVGHFNDDFLPIITKRPAIANQDVLDVFRALYETNPSVALQAAEEYLIQAVAFYSGGTTV